MEKEYRTKSVSNQFDTFMIIYFKFLTKVCAFYRSLNGYVMSVTKEDN